MVGVIVEDMPRAVEFYRRLGFLSTTGANARWDPARTPASGGYRFVLELYLDSLAALDAEYEELTGTARPRTSLRTT